MRLLREGFYSLWNVPAERELLFDGLRAVSCLWIFVIHLWAAHSGLFTELVSPMMKSLPWQWLTNSSGPMNMFFCLSGFLMGLILFRETRQSGSVRIWRFYLRRLLRLYPVYVVVLLGGSFFMKDLSMTPMQVLGGTEFPGDGNFSQLWANLLYVNNFLPFDQQYMPWTWSIAVEMQFYLLIPLLVLGVSRFRDPGFVLFSLILFLGLFKVYLCKSIGFEPPIAALFGSPQWNWYFERIYDNFYTRAACILTGTFFSYLYVYKKEELQKALLWPGMSLLALVLSLQSPLLSHYEPFYVFLGKLSIPYFSFQDILFSSGLSMLILMGLFDMGIGRFLRRILSTRPLFMVAQLSYIIYLVHGVFMMALVPKMMALLEGQSWIVILSVNSAVFLFLTFFVSVGLFIFVEQPAIRFKNYLSNKISSQTGPA